MTCGVNTQTFLQANNNHIMTAKWLMGSFCKTTLWALAKCLASAWEVHDSWYMTSSSCATCHDWSTTTWHADDDCTWSWVRLCCFTPFIMVIVKWCCHVKSFTVGPYWEVGYHPWHLAWLIYMATDWRLSWLHLPAACIPGNTTWYWGRSKGCSQRTLGNDVILAR